MSDHSDFLAWVRTSLYEAELAIHNGDAGPRRALWSREEPVSVLGAWRNAFGQRSSMNCSPAFPDVPLVEQTKGLQLVPRSVPIRPAWSTRWLPWSVSRAATSCGPIGLPPRARRVEGSSPPWRHSCRVTAEG